MGVISRCYCYCVVLKNVLEPVRLPTLPLVPRSLAVGYYEVIGILGFVSAIFVRPLLHNFIARRGGEGEKHTFTDNCVFVVWRTPIQPYN